jgi:hypothetical protein
MLSLFTHSLVPTTLVLAQAVHAAVTIDHDPVEEARSGKRIEIDASVSSDDADGIREVRTYFRADGDGRWHYVPMRPDGSDFAGLLPAPNVHTDVVRYQLLAITAGRNLVKSDIFDIEIEKDKDALARLESKPPRDVKIDVSELQDARDIIEQLDGRERVSFSDRRNEATQAGEANPDSRVDVRSEYNPVSDAIPGFDDYINLSYVGTPAGYGVAAGMVSKSASVGGAPAAGTVSTSAAASGGGGAGWVLGGLALAGGAAAAAGGGGGGGDDDGGTTNPGSVTNFAGRTVSPVDCPGNTGNAANRWVVDLSQTNDQITGVIAFHDCPGGGRASYNVTGTATTAGTVSLDGTLDFSVGPLAATVPATQVFTVSPGSAPNPNFAP